MTKILRSHNYYRRCNYCYEVCKTRSPVLQYCSVDCVINANIKFIGECWLWIGKYTSSSYIQINFNKKRINVSRYMYEKYNKKVDKKCNIGRNCGENKCINPKHLITVSKSDRVIKKRIEMRKVNPEDVEKIRLDSRKNREIAEEYGLTIHHVRSIKNGQIWNEDFDENKVVKNKTIGNAKVNLEIARKIRLEAGLIKDIAFKYNLNRSTISKIKKNITWKEND